jgi:hypothetical protein
MNFTGRQHSGIDDARNIARILGWSKKSQNYVLYIDESPARARFGVEFQQYNYIDFGSGQVSFPSDNRWSILVSTKFGDRISISTPKFSLRISKIDFAYSSGTSPRGLTI